MLASSADNIRFNGTGRGFFQPRGTSGLIDLGEMENLTFSVAVETDKINTTRDASRATILERETSREGSLSTTLRESTEENLLLAFLGSSFSAASQALGAVALAEVTRVADRYVELGDRDVFVTKLTHGEVADGPFSAGETVTGGTSSATGVVLNVGSGFLEIGVSSGTFAAAETITGGTSSASASLTAVDTLEDVVVMSAATAGTRYVQGTDYTVDAQAGFLRVLSTGSIAANPYVGYGRPALTVSTAHMLESASAEGRFLFVQDSGDSGPRMEYDFHRVTLKLNGDYALIGDGASGLPMTGTVLKDSAKPSGQQYFQARELRAA